MKDLQAITRKILNGPVDHETRLSLMARYMVELPPSATRLDALLVVAELEGWDYP